MYDNLQATRLAFTRWVKVFCLALQGCCSNQTVSDLNCGAAEVSCLIIFVHLEYTSSAGGFVSEVRLSF